MPNPIKYNTSSETLALKKGNFWIGTGDVDKGPTSSTGFYNGITPPSGGYTIYLNKASGGPSIYTPTSDAQLITLTNQIAGTSYTTVAQCVTYFNGQTDKMVLNLDYGKLQTTNLTLCLDAGFTASINDSSTITDLTNNQYVFNYEGTVSLTNGSDGALYLNSGRIYRDSLGWYGNYTISFWMKYVGSVNSSYFYTESNRGPSGCWRVASFLNANGTFGYQTYDNSTQATYGNGYITVNSTTNVCDGSWHQITCTWANGSSNKSAGRYIYVDGILEGSQTNNIVGNDGSYASMHLGGVSGCLGTTTHNCYLGPIVQYNDYALSDTQVTNLYNTYSNRY
jgi:hypothetical protein